MMYDYFACLYFRVCGVNQWNCQIRAELLITIHDPSKYGKTRPFHFRANL